MNYEETMSYIKYTANKFGGNYGLSRTEKVLDLLDNPHKKIKCIHVAGTNGKGSTSSMISKILTEAGYKVGLYISPYLEEFEERIQINGQNIPKEDLCEIITEMADVVDKVAALGYEHPTEFEIVTSSAFLYFYRQKVDYAVIEVGLGGRLDSTNVITPVVSVITSISYDHMNILGDTLTEIAKEKAGIIKPEIPVILYPQEEESEKVIEEFSKLNNSKLIKVSKDSVKLLNNEVLQKESSVFCGNYYQQIEVKTQQDKYNINLSLLGKHQLLNCATAISCIEELSNQGAVVSKENILNALSNIKWKGRLEVMSQNPLVVIDGAHNSDGIRRLKESVEKYFKYKKMVLILGILADKEVERMVSTIASMASKIITVTPHSDRAELSNTLKDVVYKHNQNCESIEDYETAYMKALSYCDKDDMLLISGSLYMIGDMRKIIRQENSAN